MAKRNMTELEQYLTLPGGARPWAASSWTGKRRMDRVGIGHIFPIWHVNEGRSLDSLSGSQQASMAKYQQRSRTLEPASRFGRSQLCRAEERRLRRVSVVRRCLGFVLRLSVHL